MSEQQYVIYNFQEQGYLHLEIHNNICYEVFVDEDKCDYFDSMEEAFYELSNLEDNVKKCCSVRGIYDTV